MVTQDIAVRVYGADVPTTHKWRFAISMTNDGDIVVRPMSWQCEEGTGDGIERSWRFEVTKVWVNTKAFPDYATHLMIHHQRAELVADIPEYTDETLAYLNSSIRSRINVMKE